MDSSRMTDSPSDLCQQMTVSDISRHSNVTLDVANDRTSADDILIRGQLYHQELRKGLFLHVGDAYEEQPFTTQSTQQEGLSCIFFLQGDVDVTIGNRCFDFRNTQDKQIKAAAIVKTSQEYFQRKTAKRQHVRHLVITATPQWLNMGEMHQIHGSTVDTHLLSNHMASHRWLPSPRLCDAVRDILAPSVLVPELRNLYLEGRAIEIVTETLSCMMQSDHRVDNRPVLTRRESICLQRAKECVSASLDQPLTVEYIAQQAGVSVSGLQRLFRRAEGKSVFEYVRLIRMDHALSALQFRSASVQEASSIAGYSNPANFATAFKRQFGITPREASRTQRCITL